MKSPRKLTKPRILYLLMLCGLLLGGNSYLHAQTKSGDTVLVEMVALDQPIMYNRLGAALPTGMMFALKRDVESKLQDDAVLEPGNVRLRGDKRPRPIVLRANVGDIIQIKFTNLLTPFDSTAIVNAFNTDRPAEVTQIETNATYPKTRHAGVHILGTELINTINSDGSWAGANDNSLAAPGETKTYTLFAPKQGTFMLYSSADILDNAPIRAAQLSNGLFGSLTVQPPGAEWYRSQTSQADLNEAITGWKVRGSDVISPDKQEDAFPIIDYDKTYANGDPILKLYKQIRPHARELIYTDLTAIITGPNKGNFPDNTNDPSFFEVPASPNRNQPFREFAIHYHEAPYVVQAFPVFYDKGEGGIHDITGTLQAGVDRFAINYGTGGIGAEIYANRIGIGPMADCVDCAYEEFFLSSWTVGDPAMVVDVPANTITNDISSVDSSLQNQFLWNVSSKEAIADTHYGKFKASKALYPDDPSNVYHSYMNDHTKFRLTHAGGGVTHVHHQHAHQWLHSPNSDNGHYLDSQTINPGSSYTLEIVYDGSGNLNKTVGDQIFHCHFYPHFAQGMWSMWRVHDVLETGTELDENLLPVDGSRALPDGEIPKGTAIPAVVPIPTLAMAPIPAEVHIENGQIVIDDDTKNPGYPFFIPGIAGSRAPHPPLDFAHGTIYDQSGDSIDFGPLNGGLPRSIVVDGVIPFENHTIYDWTKITDSIEVLELPEEGTVIEKVAMATHAQRNHPTLTPSGDEGNFVLNGQPAVSGAPYANPAVDLEGNSVGTKRVYKAANIQIDAVLNKKGWHYPQQRIISLWGDVASNVSGIKPPEPFFFRANSTEYIEFWHTNLVPEYYELDDFQVRTPTDIIGQHIHLVKFDVTSSDGAANGWNYEDGSLASDLVRERISSINEGGKRYMYEYKKGESISDMANYDVNPTPLAPHAPNPVWGTAPEGQNWTGAQTTIQRWYADPLLNNKGEDRTLRTVFTHDHFGPSTHQQAGLYAGLLIEPQESKWYNPVTGQEMGFATNGVTRNVMVDNAPMTVSDGGPTSWQANIVTTDANESYREFMLEFQDSQLAYTENSRGEPDPYPHFPTNPDAAQKAEFEEKANAYRGWMDTPFAINPPKDAATGNPQPQLVSNGFIGTYSMNYRMEPIPLRAADDQYQQASGNAGNLAYSFNSEVERASSVFNSQPTPGGSISDSNDFKFPVDPLSPGMEPKDPYTPLFRAYENDRVQVRTLVGAHITSHFFNINGANWYFEPSFMNSGFRSTQNMGLSEHFEMYFKLPVTEKGEGQGDHADYLYRASAGADGMKAGLWGMMRAYDSEQPDIVPLPNNDITQLPAPEVVNCGCPEGAPVREIGVTALSIVDYNNFPVNGGQLVYNEMYNNLDPGAIVYVLNEDVDKFKNEAGWQVEPLVLRAVAGECIKVNLTNSINPYHTSNTTNYTYNDSISVNLAPSADVALHADLLSYNVTTDDGSNAGFNSIQSVPIGENRTYEWFAGTWQIRGFDTIPIPVEFGTVTLSSPDPMEQYIAGLFGVLIVEPVGATWEVDENSNSSANVTYTKNGNTETFREMVFQIQDFLAVPSVPRGDGPKYADVNYAINYKSEPMASRLNVVGTNNFNSVDAAQSASNTLLANNTYPETPHFVVGKNTPIRIRLAHPGGNNSEVFNLHGHVWQEAPYENISTVIGRNDTSQWFGFRDQVGPLNSFDLLIQSAGGVDGVTGDYLYNSFTSSTYGAGLWGVMSVTGGNDLIYVSNIKGGKTMTIAGSCTVDPATGKMPTSVSIMKGTKKVVSAPVDKNSGAFSFKNVNPKALKKGLLITSTTGGKRFYSKEQVDKMIKEPLSPATKGVTPQEAKRMVDPNQNPGMKPLRETGKRRPIHNSSKKVN